MQSPEGKSYTRKLVERVGALFLGVAFLAGCGRGEAQAPVQPAEPRGPDNNILYDPEAVLEINDGDLIVVGPEIGLEGKEISQIQIKKDQGIWDAVRIKYESTPYDGYGLAVVSPDQGKYVHFTGMADRALGFLDYISENGLQVYGEEQGNSIPFIDFDTRYILEGSSVLVGEPDVVNTNMDMLSRMESRGLRLARALTINYDAGENKSPESREDDRVVVTYHEPGHFIKQMVFEFLEGRWMPVDLPNFDQNGN